LPSGLWETVRLAYHHTDPPALRCSPGPSQAPSRGRRCGTKMLPESRPSLTIGSQVHFCLCHLPSHLKGSHSGFIGFLISFQLSLIAPQNSKSSQARADRERSRPSATRSWSSLPHLQGEPVKHAFHQGSAQMGGMPNHRQARGPPWPWAAPAFLPWDLLQAIPPQWKNLGVSDQRF